MKHLYMEITVTTVWRGFTYKVSSLISFPEKSSCGPLIYHRERSSLPYPICERAPQKRCICKYQNIAHSKQCLHRCFCHTWGATGAPPQVVLEATLETLLHPPSSSSVSSWRALFQKMRMQRLECRSEQNVLEIVFKESLASVCFKFVVVS
jgi:hypothetical protein